MTLTQAQAYSGQSDLYAFVQALELKYDKAALYGRGEGILYFTPAVAISRDVPMVAGTKIFSGGQSFILSQESLQKVVESGQNSECGIVVSYPLDALQVGGNFHFAKMLEKELAAFGIRSLIVNSDENIYPRQYGLFVDMTQPNLDKAMVISYKHMPFGDQELVNRTESASSFLRFLRERSEQFRIDDAAVISEENAIDINRQANAFFVFDTLSEMVEDELKKRSVISLARIQRMVSSVTYVPKGLDILIKVGLVSEDSSVRNLMSNDSEYFDRQAKDLGTEILNKFGELVETKRALF